MLDNQTSRYYPGQNCERDNGIMSDLPVLYHIGRVHEYQNDFDDYFGPAAAGSSGGWTLTGAGSAANVAGDGAFLNLVSPVSAFQSIQKVPASWVVARGLRGWGQFQLAIDSLLGSIVAGIMNLTATPFTPASITDGIYFTSAANTGVLTANVANAGVISSIVLATSLVPNQQALLSAYWDGGVYSSAPGGRVIFEASGPGVTANVRGEFVIPASTAIAGTVAQAVTLGVNASTAVARTLSTDRVYVAKDEININSTPPF